MFDSHPTTGLDELIGLRAYQKWQARGCPPGDGQSDWYAARAEIETELAALARETHPTPLTATEHHRLAYERQIAAYV